MTFEHRTFTGETATQVLDGWAGWRLGKRYRIRITPAEDGRLRLADADAPADAPTAGAVATVTPQEFDRWWKP